MHERSFHDEPFVIDNSPVAIDVGEKHRASLIQDPKTGDFIRKHSDLDRIVVLRKKGHVVAEFETQPLNGTPVTMRLSRFDHLPAVPQGTLTISWEPDVSDPKPSVRFNANFKLAPVALVGKSRRLHQSSNTNLRILSIEGGGMSNISFDGQDDVVFVVFCASKPDDH